MKDEDFLLIPAFTVTRLGLTGNEQKLYSLIWGFSKDGTSEYKGSVGYMAEWLNTSSRTIFNVLKSLKDKGLIESRDIFTNGVKFVAYKAVVPEFHTQCKNFMGGMKNFHGGYEEFSHNNIEDNIEDNIATKDNNKEKCRTCNSNSMNDTRANDDEVSTSKSSSELSVPNSKKSTKFIPPTQEEVIDYCNQKSLSVDPYYFYSYYTEADWHDAKGRPVKNWKQRMITWNANAKAKEYSRSKASEASDTNKSEESDERFKKALDDYPWCKTVDDFHVVTEYGNTFYIPKFTEDGKRVNEAGLIMED